jgi:hypothetical protein
MGSTNESGKPYDLDVQLETCTQEYEEDRDKYWKTRPEGGDWDLVTRLRGHADKVAALLLKDTHDLVKHDGLEGPNDQFGVEHAKYLKEMQDEITSFIDLVRQKLPTGVSLDAFEQYIERRVLNQRPPEDSVLKLVWERLCIDLASDFAGDRLIAGANRILQLGTLLLNQTPANATLRFLRRIARCYIWGFDAECIILCRGAIDTAFKGAVSDAVCDKHGLNRAAYGHTLTNRINAALKERMIDDATKRAAFQVNTPATRAAHENPDEATRVLRVIKDTRDVIQRLATGP